MNLHTPRPTCYICYRPKKACFCDEISPFQTNFTFCILMHPLEAKVGHVGTGRIANFALKNSTIIVDETFDDNHEVQKILISDDYFPMILYPGKNSMNISRESFPNHYFQHKKPLLFILDGTWSCAKSMIRDSKTLHDLPRISFDSNITSRFSIRQQPGKFCLSTIESIHQVLVNLERLGWENLGKKKGLLPLYLQKIVDFQKKCAEDPELNSYSRKNGFYKDPENRRPSKKWEKRKICF